MKLQSTGVMSLAILVGIFVIGCLDAQEVAKAGVEIGDYDKPLDILCEAGRTLNVSLVWRKDATDIEFTSASAIKVYLNVPENSTLRILKVGPLQSGNFSCWDSYGGLLQTFDVQVRPYVHPYEKPRNIIQDDPLQIVCNAWGIPTPVLTWTHGNRTLEPDSRVTFKNATLAMFSNFVLENGTLRIEPVQFEDAGNYTCIATSINGNASATLVVHVKDKFAALWPFLGICAEVAILCTIILIYEKRRESRLKAEDQREEAAHLNANNDAKAALPSDDVRQRK
jgi:hypothetical protein